MTTENSESESLRSHWQGVHEQKGEREVSWFQERPETSLRLIAKCDLAPTARVIDVGGGASRLVDELVAGGSGMSRCSRWPTRRWNGPGLGSGRAGRGRGGSLRT